MKQKWFSILKDKFDESDLVLNVALAAIFLGLEKLLELEFNCPCSPWWNVLYSAGFFIIPPSISFTLMLLIQNYRCKCTGQCFCQVSGKNCGKMASSFSFALMWLVLVLYDGQYFACGFSNWEGSYASIENLKWCRPENATEERRTELTRRVTFLYMYSQVRPCGNGVGGSGGYVSICIHFLQSV